MLNQLFFCVHVLTEGMEIFDSNQDRKSSHFFLNWFLSGLARYISNWFLEMVMKPTISGKEQSPDFEYFLLRWEAEGWMQ